jgi:hypothetical protein
MENSPGLLCWAHLLVYSANVVEEKFSEVRLTAILGSPHTRCGIGPGICRKALACPDLRTQWGTPLEGPPFPSKLLSKHMPSAKKTPICDIFEG